MCFQCGLLVDLLSCILIGSLLLAASPAAAAAVAAASASLSH